MTLALPILVQKYGGSSVATPDHIRRVAKRVVNARRSGQAVVVVVSAMGKTTDQLLELSRAVTERPSRRELDMLLHAGEIISSALLAMAIEREGEAAISFTGAQAGMITDESHTEARIRGIQGERIHEELRRGRIVVIAGFQGVTAAQEVTTLGRGGSDTSAVAFAVGIGAHRCEILTDVDGVYTADPRVVAKPHRMRWCSFDEMLEMASLGSKVLHSRSVEIARRYDTPVLVSSSFENVPGTLICSTEFGRKEFGAMEDVSIRGVAHDEKVTKVSLVGVPDRPGIAARVFEVLSERGTRILLIAQAEHRGGTNDISFLVPSDSLVHIREDLERLAKELGDARLVIDAAVGTVSVVGDGVRSDPRVAARMFAALARESINIDLISTSNLTVSCVVPLDRLHDAVRAAHRELIGDAPSL